MILRKLTKGKLTKELASELPALRVKLGYSQTEMGGLIGVSRQTYSMIETQKKEMGWSVYMALILVFSTNLKTSVWLDFSGVFPKELQLVLRS